MKTHVYIALLSLSAFLCMSCAGKDGTEIDENAHKQYLAINTDNQTESKTTEIQFWNKKHDAHPNQFPYLVQMANAHTELFQLNGKFNHVKSAHELLLKANEQTNYSKAGYLRSLALNLMTQHRFREAFRYLEIAEKNGEHLEATRKMLFDVLFDMGDMDKAEVYLRSIQDERDFDYLIRMAKWQDRIGNLSKAIEYLEKALIISENIDNRKLREWTYSNLADFYGHDGQIERSYEYHLKALELNPLNHHSKKGIAWILYSHLNKPEAALNVLEDISSYNHSPDYSVLKAEIASYLGDQDLKKSYIKDYVESIIPDNEQMYGAYSIPLYAEELNDPELAVRLAEKETEERPTAMSFDLLAWACFLNGEHDRALEIVQTKVYDKTFEPMALYHMLKIYDSKGMVERVKRLKRQLEGTEFELGPIISHEIKNL